MLERYFSLFRASLLLSMLGLAIGFAQRVEVTSSDTLTSIAAKYNVTVEQLSTVNGLAENARLYEGDLIYITAADRVEQNIKTITIEQGDTLIRLANEYSTSVANLIALNKLESTLIILGEPLLVPEIRSVAITEGVDLSATDSGSFRVAFENEGRRQVVVQPGDTLTDLAEAYEITVAELIDWNALASSLIVVGDLLYVEDAQEAIGESVAPSSSDLETTEVTPSEETPVTSESVTVINPMPSIITTATTIEDAPDPAQNRLSTEATPEDLSDTEASLTIRPLSETTEDLATASDEVMLASPVTPNKLILATKTAADHELFAEIIKQTLVSSGFEVETQLNVGNSSKTRQLILDGEADLYIDETGTALSQYFQGYGIGKLPTEVLSNQEAAASLTISLDSFYADLVWLCPAPANNNYVFVAKADWASNHDITSLSDLAAHLNENLSSKLSLSKDFFRASNGLAIFEEAYGFKVTDFAFTDKNGSSFLNEFLASDSQLGIMNSTDAGLRTGNVIILEDDKNVQPVLSPSPVVRLAALEANPNLAETICPVFESLDNFALSQLKQNLANGNPTIDTVSNYISTLNQ